MVIPVIATRALRLSPPKASVTAATARVSATGMAAESAARTPVATPARAAGRTKRPLPIGSARCCDSLDVLQLPAMNDSTRHRVVERCKRALLPRCNDLLHRHRTDAGQRLELLRRRRVQIDESSLASRASLASGNRAARRRGAGSFRADAWDDDLLAIGEGLRQVDGRRGCIEVHVVAVSASRSDGIRDSGSAGQLAD